MMYYYLWLRVKKALKKFSSKRDRAPRSLKECVTTKSQHRVWHNWLIVLPTLPLLYYAVFIRNVSHEHDMPSSKISRIQESNAFVEPKKDWLLSINEPSPAKKLVEERRHHNSIIDNSHYSGERMKKKHLDKMIQTSNNNELPWCRLEKPAQRIVVDLKNVSTDQSYRDVVHAGGHYAPLDCKSKHKVAIVVPFRNRQSHLLTFLNYMHPFLIYQKLEYRIFVIEQSGKHLFNRGGLLNVGFLEANKYDEWDCMVFHDVDLLPMSKLILYSCPTWPRHMCAAVVKDNNISNAHTFFGGVSSMTLKHFQKVNGFSNMYWGWGGEDSDMFLRLRAVGIPIVRYNKDIAKYMSLPHNKSEGNPNRYNLLKSAMSRYLSDGLSSLKYSILSTEMRPLYTHIIAELYLY